MSKPQGIFVLFALTLLAACHSTGPGAGLKWKSYPSLAERTTSYRWLVVKCQLADAPMIPPGLDRNIEQFMGIAGAGYANILDYFHDERTLLHLGRGNESVLVAKAIAELPVDLSWLRPVSTPEGGAVVEEEGFVGHVESVHGDPPVGPKLPSCQEIERRVAREVSRRGLAPVGKARAVVDERRRVDVGG